MMYRFFSRFYPKNIRESYTKLLKYLDMKVNPDAYVGFTVLIGLLVGLGGAFLFGKFIPTLNFFVWWILLFFMVEVIIYVPLMLKVDKKAKEVETILPDALQIMSSNLKSGLTVDQAVLSSVRPEFGSFAEELNRIGKEVTTGKSLEKALMDSTKRINSEKYLKTMELLSSGLRSGGELAKLLDHTSSNLKHQKIVDEKVRSSVMMYVIFIFFAICFGAPILFGLSSFLTDVMRDIFTKVDIPTSVGAKMTMPMLNFSGIELPSGFVMTYIIVTIILSGTMGGFIIGLISKGKEKYGFRYIPILIAVALLIFFLIRLVISNVLGGVLGL